MNDLAAGLAGYGLPVADGRELTEWPRAIELALEGLYLARRSAKDSDGSETIYG